MTLIDIWFFPMWRSFLNPAVLVCFIITVIKHWPKSTWGADWFVVVGFQIAVYHQQCQGKNLEATEAVAMVEWYLGDPFQWLFNQISYITRDHLPRWSCPSGLGSPISITHQENAPTNMPTGKSDGGNFSTEVLSSLVTLAYVTLKKTD